MSTTNNALKRFHDTILIAGYRGTGKDFLYSRLVDNTFRDFYDFYIRKDLYSIKSHYQSLFQNRKYYRYAHADALKEELAKSLNISTEELESKKDLQVYGKSYRDDLIRLGMARRQKDLKYWVKIVDKKRNYIDSQAVDVITDFRFVSEIRRDSTLIRVLRDVPLPEPDDVSERSLDYVFSDLLFLAKGSSLKSYPFYKNYIRFNV